MGCHGRVSVSNFRLRKLSSDGPSYAIHDASVANRPALLWVHMPPSSGLYTTVSLTS